MSDTQRTDAARHNMGSVAEPHYVVDEEVAAELERELASMTSARDKAMSLLNEAIEENTALRSATQES